MTRPTGSDESPAAAAVQAAREQLRACMMFGADFVPLRLTVEPVAPDSSHEKVLVSNTPPAAAPRPATVSSGAARARPQAPASPAPAQPSLLPDIAVEVKPRVLDPRQRGVQNKLDALRERYEREAPHANFVTDHHCIVFGDGDPCARLMIIGEAPGAEEDKVGIPFVGRAGQLLEKMLGAMGLQRSDVYITNVLKTRPPNNATPTADEAAACAPYLFEQIRIIGPECILALGLPATKVLLNTVDAMSRLRGKWWEFTDPGAAGFSVPVMPTYHPAFLLRSYTRENREKVWSDLQMVMQKLGLSPAKAGGN